jgi:Leucine-rich repeat (LRR) protein
MSKMILSIGLQFTAQISTIEVEKLSKLAQIAILDLQNNAIQTVPPELGNLTQLRTVQLEV